MKNKFQVLRLKALKNWYMKDFVNEEMEPNVFFATVLTECIDNEGALRDEFLDLLMEWSNTCHHHESPNGTIDHFNKTFN